MPKKGNAGFGFIEILLVLVIVSFIFYKLINVYFRQAPVNKETQKALSEQGINSANYKSITDTTRKKLQDIQNQRINELDSIK